MSAIDELVKLVPPPANPIENSGNWDQICEQLGTPLPDDLRILSSRYGNGAFDQGELRIRNPFVASYLQGVQSLCDQLRESIDALLINESYSVFPEPGGLFPLGSNSSGRDLNWLTKGPSEKWPIIILVPGYQDETEQWDMPLIEFLVAMFNNKIKTRMYPKRLSKANWNFRQ